jgi:hypothetical protein
MPRAVTSPHGAPLFALIDLLLALWRQSAGTFTFSAWLKRGKKSSRAANTTTLLAAGPVAPVQVASVSTLWHRALRSNRIESPEAHLVIVDECRHATAKTWRNILVLATWRIQIPSSQILSEYQG